MDSQTGSRRRWVSTLNGCESSRKETLGVSVSPSVTQAWQWGWWWGEGLQATGTLESRAWREVGQGQGSLPCLLQRPALSSAPSCGLQRPPLPSGQQALRPGHRQLQADLVWPVPLPEPGGAGSGDGGRGQGCPRLGGEGGQGPLAKAGKGDTTERSRRALEPPSTSWEEDGAGSPIIGHQGAPEPRAGAGVGGRCLGQAGGGLGGGRGGRDATVSSHPLCPPPLQDRPWDRAPALPEACPQAPGSGQTLFFLPPYHAGPTSQNKQRVRWPRS